MLGASLTAQASVVVSAFPASFLPGLPFTVTNAVAPDPAAFVYAVEDTTPLGWSVSNISDSGTFSPDSHTVQWGPFFDAQPRSLTYSVTPPANASGTCLFVGDAVFDLTETVVITGQRSAVATIPVTNAVVRSLPASFIPGASFLVTNQATIAPGVLVYAVSDTLPVGWGATNLSDGGSFDPATGQVRWGPFFDHLSRPLVYAVMPPLSALTAVTFLGSASIDGVSLPVTGQSQVAPLLSAIGSVVSFFPPQFTPGQWFTVTNLVEPGTNISLFAAQDTVPAGWTVSNLSSGGSLDAASHTIHWGPFAGHQSLALTYSILPPSSFTGVALFGGSASFDSFSVPITGRRQATAFAVFYGTADCTMPVDASPGVAFAVTIQVTPATNTTVCAVSDAPPAGWAVADVSDQGLFDPASRLVKWGPFFDAQPRSLSYQLTPPADPSADPAFAGEAVFDNATVSIGGQRSITLTVPSAGTVVSSLPALYSPSVPFLLTDVATPAVNIQVYAVEDTVPTGWGVTNISDGGSFDPQDSTVRWGPFFDDSPRSLTCTVVPSSAPSAPAAAVFSGKASFDFIEVAITRQRLSTRAAASPGAAEITSVLYLRSGSLRIDLVADSGASLTVRASTNLHTPVADWTILGSPQSLGGTAYRFEDSQATNFPTRFYYLH